jgi:hypothetical protein
MTKSFYQKLQATLLTYLLITPSLAFAATIEPLFDGCDNSADPLKCWLEKVFDWSQMAILVLATVVIVIAGVLYMTSAGNPDRITQSKKLIYGALTGVAIIILGRFFLTAIIGIGM